jgi:hypothetical protein
MNTSDVFWDRISERAEETKSSLSERLYDEYGKEYYCSHLFRDSVSAPGEPGKDPHCITGCNARFNKFNRQIHESVSAKWDGQCAL